MPLPARLDPRRSALLLVDWQERLFEAMPAGARDEARVRAANLRWLCSELELPMFASEQYPRGLGRTLPDLLIPDTVEKLSFSALRVEGLATRLADALPSGSEPRNVLLAGMETHICVAQTARDLGLAGYRVWLVADACLSRRRFDWDMGVQRIHGDGAIIVSAEAALFELLGEAGTPLFKELSRRIR